MSGASRAGFGSAAVVGLFLLAGCDGLGVGSAGWDRAASLTKTIPGATAPRAFEAAVDELRDNFKFHVIDANVVTGRIVCEPQFMTRGDGTSANEFRILSTRSDLRRSVRVRVVDEATAVRVEVAAHLERRDTQQARAYQALRSSGDAPSETPVATESGPNPEHNEVWNFIGRDNVLENEIMSAIENHFKSPTTRPGEN